MGVNVLALHMAEFLALHMVPLEWPGVSLEHRAIRKLKKKTARCGPKIKLINCLID